MSHDNYRVRPLGRGPKVTGHGAMPKVSKVTRLAERHGVPFTVERWSLTGQRWVTRCVVQPCGRVDVA